MSLTNALKWSFLSEIAAKAIQPLVFIILARLLTPEDFGVIAAATMVISFSQIFWEAGMGKAVIQYQGEQNTAANAAFWINNALAVLVCTLLLISSGIIANKVFHDFRVTAVLQIMALQILLSALVSVHTALLQKEMQFKSLFWVRLLTVLASGFVSIPLAWRGMGYWALVAGTLAGQSMQVIFLWKVSFWKPRFNIDIEVAGRLIRFGGWVAVTGLLGWFYLWVDALIVGMYLGSHDLGLYRTGNQFITLLFALLFGPIIPVLFSHFSRMNRDLERLRQAMQKVIQVLIFTALPVAFILASFSGPIVAVIFGPNWKGLELVIAVMALMHGYSWIVSINGEAYRAMGKPALETSINAMTLVVYLSVYLVSIQYGFETFIWSRFALAMGALIMHLGLLKKVFSFRLWPSMRSLVVVSVLCWVITEGTGRVLFNLTFQPWINLFMGMAINTALIGAVLFILERKGVIADLLELIRSHST